MQLLIHFRQLLRQGNQGLENSRSHVFGYGLFALCRERENTVNYPWVVLNRYTKRTLTPADAGNACVSLRTPCRLAFFVDV